jgi:GT2 family glycosyltransferase
MDNLIKTRVKVYVLILNYNSSQDTIQYVNCLQRQELVDLNILLVDNCSPNNSFELLDKEYKNSRNIEVIKSHRNGGYAYGNNFGLRYLEDKDFDFLLISNNDIEIADQRLIFKMIKSYCELTNPAFVSPIMLENNVVSKYPAWRIPSLISDLKASFRLLNIVLPNYSAYKIHKDKNVMEVDCVPGSFFLSSKAIIYKLGLMDEATFLYMEEAILGFKVKQHSLQNYLLTNLNFNHKTSSTISTELSSISMRKHLIDSRIYFHKKYLQTTKIGLFLLAFFFEIWKIETHLINYFKRQNRMND